MPTYVLTYWTGTEQTVSAESVQAAFELVYGPVTDTGYTESGVWLAGCEVHNREGDLCAMIAERLNVGDTVTVRIGTYSGESARVLAVVERQAVPGTYLYYVEVTAHSARLEYLGADLRKA